METGTLEKKIKLLSIEQKQKLEHVVDDMLHDNDIAVREKSDKSKSKTIEVKAGFGGGKHLIVYMSDDFNEPMDEFKDYM